MRRRGFSFGQDGRRVFTRAEDELHLTILDLHERQGLSAKQISDQSGGAMTKGVVSGILHRVRTETALHPCECERAENRDGGMPERWWAA